MEALLKSRKFLVFGAAIIILFILSIYFLIPQVKEIIKVKEDLSKTKLQYQLYSGYQNRLASLGVEKAEMTKNMNKLRTLYPANIGQKEILILLNYLSEKSGIIFSNISIAQVKILTGNPVSQQLSITDSGLKDLAIKLGIAENSLKNAVKGPTGIDKIADGTAYSLEVALSSSGSYTQFKTLFSLIKNLPNKVVLTQFSATNNNGKLASMFSLEFIGIADKYASFKGFPMDKTWKPSKTGNKKNIFNMGKSTNTAQEPELSKVMPVTTVKTSRNRLSKSDFTMRVVPYGNNLAPSTVALAAKSLVKDTKKALIYADNKGEETVEFYITEKNGKFYCKYRTEKAAFPDLKLSKYYQFKPTADKIIFTIDSTKKISNLDKAGVLLKAFNNTTKALAFEIINEDLTSKRVKIEQNQGNIEVLYK